MKTDWKRKIDGIKKEMIYLVFILRKKVENASSFATRGIDRNLYL